MDNDTSQLELVPSAMVSDSTTTSTTNTQPSTDHHDQQQQQQQQYPNPIVRIMLHTEDGMIPYLTPDLVERLFPSSQYSTMLCLGIAVNETCVTPIYHSPKVSSKTTSKTKNKKRKSSKEPNSNEIEHDTNADATTIPTTITNAAKPRGYTFASTTSNVSHDPSDLTIWCNHSNYQRIMVPTLDPYKNCNGISSSSLQQQQEISHQSSLSSSSSSSSSASIMRLWTSNGRHGITTKQYIECAMNAVRATIIVPLHDEISSDTSMNSIPAPNDDIVVVPKLAGTSSQNFYSSHNQKEFKRNLCRQNWIEEHQIEIVSQQQKQEQLNRGNQQSISSQTVPPQICFPLVVSSDTHLNTVDDTLSEHSKDASAKDHCKRSDARQHVQWLIQSIHKQYSTRNNTASIHNDTGKYNHQLLTNNMIMLIGWHNIVDHNQRWCMIQALHTMLLTPTMVNVPIPRVTVTLGTIATSSTQQFIQCLQYSILACDETTSSSNPILIGTNLPTIWARTKRCFVINIDVPKNGIVAMNQDNTDSSVPQPTLDADGCYDFDPLKVPIRTEHIFFSDSQPLLKDCTCMTCSTYTRAYLYHLVCAQELLVEILFFIHNLHHLLHLTRVVNGYHRINDSESIQELCQLIKQQIERN
jgi:Queuine tRNA-ribosyltransferase